MISCKYVSQTYFCPIFAIKHAKLRQLGATSNTMPQQVDPRVLDYPTTLIKELYHSYRHTADLDYKGLFFSPSCLQICRPTPSYAATTRKEIVQYLRDAQEGKVPVEATTAAPPDKSQAASTHTESNTNPRSVYTIRALREEEIDFGTKKITAPIGLAPDELRRKAEQESWVGMRVDLWDENSDSGLLVKVQYWWRRERIPEGERIFNDDQEVAWKQCLHNIMYLGPKDGTEGGQGVEILE